MSGGGLDILVELEAKRGRWHSSVHLLSTSLVLAEMDGVMEEVREVLQVVVGNTTLPRGYFSDRGIKA